ncbi:MAG: HEAT repeat domain-containing protein [Gemmatales bacterium]
MSKKSIWVYGIILVLVAGASVGLWQQNTLAAWYRTWKLQSASADSLSGYVRTFEALGVTGTESLIGCFQSKNETACQNAGHVLSKILKIWPINDSRRTLVIQQLADQAPSYSSFGQREALTILLELMQGDSATPEMQKAFASVIANSHANAECRLQVYAVLMQALQNVENIDETLYKQAKSLVIVGTKSDQEAVRVATIRLAVLPGLQLHEHLAPLLASQHVDPSHEVRQLALLALGEHEKLLATDDLCKFLNDSDREVRSIAERALQVRGLSLGQIKLARLMHDENAVHRAELAGLVMNTSEVDCLQWMERLIRDPSPAVRASAARAMGSSADQRMTTLLRTLTEQEQDQTVHQIARYYLRSEAK